MKTRFGVGVFVVENDHVLLMKRGEECSHGAGCWALPGGWHEDDESIFDTGVREVKEELNIDIRKTKLVGITEKVEYILGARTLVVVLWMTSRMVDKSQLPKIMEPTKCSEIKWARFRDIERNMDKEQEKWIPIHEWYKWYARIFSC